jgi:hypothetical protein
VPSSLDREQINALLVEPKRRLLELNEKISEMERIMEPLKLERDSLDDEIEQHTRLLATFHCFPDDMLREVFLACLPVLRNAVMSPKEAPLLLGRVCRRWRSVVYSTPSLWASLHIPYPAPLTQPPHTNEEARRLIECDQEKLKKHQAAVKDWIQRSGACPLSLSFICNVGAELHNANRINIANLIQSYLDIILSVSHRWNALVLYITPGKFFDQIASIHRTSVPMLKHLRLSFSSSLSIEDRQRWSSSMFLNSISLSSLDITSIPFRPNSVSSDFWSNLSYLTLDNKMSYNSSLSRNLSSIEDAFFIFSRCRRLVHCSLQIFDRPDATSPSGVISLPHLKSLSIVESCQSLSTLFEWFTDLSALRGVSYHSTERPSNRRPSPLITLLTRTQGQLQHLITNLSYYTLADLTAVFALVPNLTHFTDEYSPAAPKARNPHLPKSFSIGRVFLDLLTPFGNGPTYCPRLQALRLKHAQCSDRDVLAFLQRRMGASRCRPGGGIEPLREFQAVLVHPAKLDLPALLAEYVEDGPLTLDFASSRPQRTGWQHIDPRVGLVKRNIPDIVRACQS